jgi:hypothetical protein
VTPVPTHEHPEYQRQADMVEMHVNMGILLERTQRMEKRQESGWKVIYGVTALMASTTAILVTISVVALGA